MTQPITLLPYTLYATSEGEFIVASTRAKPAPGYSVRRYEDRVPAERARARIAKVYEIAGRPTIVARHPLNGLVTTRWFRPTAAWCIDVVNKPDTEVVAALFPPEGLTGIPADG